MASFKVVGNFSPVVGVPEVYSVVELAQQSFLINTPNMDFTFFSSKTQWKMWMYNHGYWRAVKGVKKEGATVIFTFFTKSLRCRALRMTAKVNGEEVVVDIKPQKANQSEIVNIEILNINHDKPTKRFSYGELFTARIHAVRLDLTSVTVTLWEDDANGAGHNKENTFIESKTASIINGRADVDFYLSPNFSALANSKFSSGSDSEGPMHEYYVTAESKYSEPKLVASPNFDIANNIVIPDFEPTNSLMTVEVLSKEEEEEKKARSCICKEYDLIWGNKVSCEFRKKVVEIAKRLNKDANLLMAAIALETNRTFSPTAGKGTSYVGLIQFGDYAAQSIGTTRAKLLKMTALEQLDYVEKYLEKKKDRLVTLTDFYLSIIMPVDVGKGSTPNHVVFDNEYPLEYLKDGKTLTDLSRSRHYGYRQNRIFLYEKDEKEKVKKGGGKKYDGPGKTYIWEIEKYITSVYDEGKANKASFFLCDKDFVTKSETELGTWNVIITEKYTGKKCTHDKKLRKNCRRGIIEVFDHNKGLVLTIDDSLMEGWKGENRMKTANDTPFGIYKINDIPFIKGGDRLAYGPNPRLAFEPIKDSGDEIDKSGRSQIRIHGGRQEKVKDGVYIPILEPELLRTSGCIRVLDADRKRLYDWWVEYHKANPKIKPGKVEIK